jgi:hypothetical protein
LKWYALTWEGVLVGCYFGTVEAARAMAEYWNAEERSNPADPGAPSAKIIDYLSDTPKAKDAVRLIALSIS